MEASPLFSSLIIQRTLRFVVSVPLFSDVTAFNFSVWTLENPIIYFILHIISHICVCMVFLKDLKLVFEEDTLYITLSILYHKYLTSSQILNLMNYIFGQKRGGHIKCLGRAPLLSKIAENAPCGPKMAPRRPQDAR